MARGQHVYVVGSVGGIRFEHHGIDMGDGTVVHLCPEGGTRVTLRDSTNRFQVRRTSEDQFSEGRPIKICQHDNALEPEIVANNAESRIGDSGYSLLGGNCEHFATLCATGVAASKQVEMGTATASVMASAATKAFWVATAKAGTQLALKNAVKIHPAAMLADGIELAALAIGCHQGLKATKAKRYAGLSGNLTAAGIGFLLAGPGGAAVFLATHTGSKGVANHLCQKVHHWLG